MLIEIGNIAGPIIEAIGVFIIVIGFLYGAFCVIRDHSKRSGEELLREFRHDIKKTMMLGLDFLVAGDIIRTVTVEYSLSGVASLGLLVLVRTVLVFTIHLEVEGRWPWQGSAESPPPS